MSKNIHHGQPVTQFGTNLEDAKIVVILLHGRGATAKSLDSLANLIQAEGISFLAPQAGLNRWYPNTAFGPLETNEPDLTAALDTVAVLVKGLREKGFSDRQIALGGFSQGACLAAEYLIRNPKRFAGLFVLSGARIGPPGLKRDMDGSFDGMPVFIGGSDVDPWVSYELIQETVDIFKMMGAGVDFRTYSGMEHTVNQDEIDAVRTLLDEAKSLISI
jgi:predicted esterase